MEPPQRLEYLLDLGFAINYIREHFAASFGVMLEFFPALEVSGTNKLNRADNIKYSLLFFCGQLTLAVVPVQNPAENVEPFLIYLIAALG
ncbi:MAG TPA: hypothetical protein VN608_06845 [Clostridia bacterium]|nr:hypothetical protein [Clostridia bacterium]